MDKVSTVSKAINISLPRQLIGKIDEAAKHEHATRSGFIRDSIMRKLNAQERWEVITDFTSVQKGGVDIDTLLKRL